MSEQTHRITVKTATGRTVTRNAYVRDYTDQDGNQYSVAYCGRAAYYITERTVDGPVWSVKAEED